MILNKLTLVAALLLSVAASPVVARLEDGNLQKRSQEATYLVNCAAEDASGELESLMVVSSGLSYLCPGCRGVTDI